MPRAPLLATLLAASSLAQAPLAYPPTKTVDVTDKVFGAEWRDPYRWLEEHQRPEAEAWFKAQAALTDETLAKLPGRDVLVDEWLTLDRLQPAVVRAVRFGGPRIFYKKRVGGENVARLYVREGWRGAERLLFDPAKYQGRVAKAGEVVTIEDIVPSWDGRYVAMGFSSGGAEWSEIRVLDVAKGTLLPDALYPSYGATGWTRDNRAFFYDAGKVTDLASPEIELRRKARLHRLGADPATDLDLLSTEASPELQLDDKEMPIVTIEASRPDLLVAQALTVQAEFKVFVAPAADLQRKKVRWTPLVRLEDQVVRSLEVQGDFAWAITHAGAPQYKVVRTPLSKPDWAHAETVIPEAADAIQYLARSKGFLVVAYSNGVTGRLVAYEFATGRAREVKLPGSGTVDVTCPDKASDRCLVELTTWTAPVARYELDLPTGTLSKSVFHHDVTYPGFEQLEAEEVEVPSHDGVLVPLSIIKKKGLPLDGRNSAILEAYGAYGISHPPYFDPQNSVALRGVVMAICHVRGGGEKGEAWYRAGFKATKPNTWKDFIACAEHLVKRGYTTPAKLAATSTSAGGILLSRAITDRPELFGAAVCNVCCANVTRMEFSANGPVNTPEFGTVAVEAEAHGLYEMDGVHHVRKGVAYPALMGVAGWNDPRVAPWQPGKLVAAVQSASASPRPVLLKVNYDNGHFSQEKQVTFRNFAGMFAFMLWQTGHPDFQPRAEAAPGKPGR